MSDEPQIVRCDESIAEPFDEVSLLGGKAASIRRLHQLEFVISPGFTLTTAACRQYFSDPDAWRSEFLAKVSESLVWLKSQEPKWLREFKKPIRFAVRSGAPVSMPGMMQTFLNCGVTTQNAESPADWQALERLLEDILQLNQVTNQEQNSLETEEAQSRCLNLIAIWEKQKNRSWPNSETGIIVEAITTVFDSWHSSQAQQYREQNDMPEQTGTAVTVQMMVPAELSGVLFTCDPHRPRNRQMVVEAVVGLGDQLVSGSTTPVRWNVSEKEGVLTEKTELNDPYQVDEKKRVEDFSRKELHKLCEQASTLRKEWRCELDIEWAMTNGTIVFLQARPVQFDASPSILSELQSDVLNEIEKRSQYRDRFWVRHNLSESLAHPTPLTWSLVSQLMSAEGGFGDLYRELGFAPSSKVIENGFLDLIGGQIYADADLLGELFCTGYPFTFDHEQLRDQPELIETAPGHFDPEHADPFLLFHLPRIAFCLLRSKWKLRKFLRDAASEFDHSTAPNLLEYVEQESQRNIASLSLKELVALLDSRIQQTNQFFSKLLLPGTIGASESRMFQKVLVSLLGKETGRSVIEALLEEMPDPLIQRELELLSQIGQNEDDRTKFLNEFGHRGPNEMELSSPRWNERPESITRQSTAINPTVSTDSQPVQPEELLTQILKEEGLLSLRSQLLTRLSRIEQLLPYREKGRHLLMHLFALLRQTTEEIARKSKLREQIYFLNREELPQLLDESHAESLHSVANERKSTWKRSQSLSMPAVIDSSRTDELFLADPSSQQGTKFQAAALSGGIAAGRLVSFEERQTGTASTECIVLISSLDAGKFPQLVDALAVIVERGGMLSHGAVLARQMKLPVVMLHDAGKLLNGATRVEVDGNIGQVRILEPGL